jgi:YD repeat-containing protein
LSAGPADDPATPQPDDHCDRPYTDPDYDPDRLFSCPPSPELLAYWEALEKYNRALEAAKAARGYGETGPLWAQAQQELYDAKNALVNSLLGGDPVLVTTGQYLLEAADIAIPGSGFEIKRRYVSEGVVIGSFGTGWAASTDSRIIRGSTRVSDAVLAEIEGLLSQIIDAYSSIDMQYEQAAAVARQIITEIYQPALADLKSLKATKARGEELALLNRHALFPGTPGYYEGVGNERLTLVDENGAPRVFEPAGPGIWVPTSYPERLYERIESKDGRGAETRAGFIYYGRGGITREYDGDGLLVKVTELNGNGIEITRDERGHIERIEGSHGAAWEYQYSGNLITRIRGPEGQELRYGYSGSDLAWAQDGEGDTIRYAYESGRLKEIIKPDGSSIKLEYGLAGEGGARLVTATTHEEGASEKFEYYPGHGITRYTNHSGVVTQYRYDGQHRTKEELHGSGLIKTYGYNALGQLEWERINGFEIRYKQE